ncbi:MAG: RES domain-containing protein [Nitriliruptor sp.]|uniref:RES family NAD+ phosphorylase n=1 Tax=Nitriliruptor sp. TaxID=2448056 RepID=UPI00349FD1DA
MTAFRISKVRRPPFDATGARLVGGRWNSVGRAVVYASSFAGPILEILAHTTRPRTLPGPHHAVRIVIPDDLVETADDHRIGAWDRGPAASRAFGDGWLDQRRSAALSVPSLPARPVGRTIVIDPAHPDADAIAVSEPFPVPRDDRLF